MYISATCAQGPRVNRRAYSGDVMSVAPPPRPRVEYLSPESPEDLVGRFAVALSSSGCPVEGSATQRHVSLRVPSSDRHFWSPFLSLEVWEEGDGAIARGRFGPHPNIWTFFVFTHAAIFVVGLFVSSYGVAQWMMGATPWALLALPAMAALHAFVFGAEYIGKGLGSEQMLVIHDFARGVVAQATPGPSADPPGD